VSLPAAAGELIGAFLGAVTVYLMYLPQLIKAGHKVFKFSDLKEPPPPGRKVSWCKIACIGTHRSRCCEQHAARQVDGTCAHACNSCTCLAVVAHTGAHMCGS
jgi:hypothetical protein